MRQTTARRLQNLGRLVPLGISIAALATYLVWIHAPDQVRWADSRVIRSYVRSTFGRQVAGDRLLATDHQAGVQKLQELIEDLSGYRKGDRLTTIAKAAVLRLSSAHAAQNNYLAAADVLEDYLRIDSKDLIIRARLYRYMARVPALRDRAIAELHDWHQMFPMNHRFAEPLANLLAEDGQVREGWQVHLTAFRRSQNNMWTLRWTEGSKTARRMMSRLVPRAYGDGMILSFRLPARATALEIGLPIYNYARFEKLHLICESDTGRLEFSPRPELLDGVTVEDGVFRVISHKPTIRFDALDTARQTLELSTHQGMTLHLLARGRAVPSPGMASFARRYRASLLALVDERDSLSISALVNQAAEDAFRYTGCRLSWRTNEVPFDRARSQYAGFQTTQNGDKSDRTTSFTASYTVGSRARFFRITLPFLPSYTWRITGIELVADGAPMVLDVDKPVALLGLQKVAGGFALLDKYPYLDFDLGKTVAITAVKISGAIR